MFQAELRSIEDEKERGLREGDATLGQLNDRLEAAETLGRDLRAEMHRLQQRVIQTRTRIGKYKVQPIHLHFYDTIRYDTRCYFNVR